MAAREKRRREVGGRDMDEDGEMERGGIERVRVSVLPCCG
jgi:hypothetical protein